MAEIAAAPTPMMRQYLELKERYPDTILFFRLGDFYEMFFEDAVAASQALQITLTARSKGDEQVPMCGVPYHAARGHVARLLAQGFKVAICDQVEEPGKGTLVKRDVTRVITPGTVFDDQTIEPGEAVCLAAVTFGGGRLRPGAAGEHHRPAALRRGRLGGAPRRRAAPGRGPRAALPAGHPGRPGHGGGGGSRRALRPSRRRRVRAGRGAVEAPPRRPLARRLRRGRAAARALGGGGGARLPGRDPADRRPATSTGSRGWPPTACCSSTRPPGPTWRSSGPCRAAGRRGPCWPSWTGR